jgi:uncharacterized cupin superfamily protein
MSETRRPIATVAADMPPRPRPSTYPPDLAVKVAGRQKRALGDAFGLLNFGVNLARLAPGTQSALRHWHTTQDEFVYIVAGAPVLVTSAGETPLAPGMCAGFAKGAGDGHMLVNRGSEDVVYLEIGDRSAGDRVIYPDDDLGAEMGADGRYTYRRKDGTTA